MERYINVQQQDANEYGAVTFATLFEAKSVDDNSAAKTSATLSNNQLFKQMPATASHSKKSFTSSMKRVKPQHDIR